MEDTKEAISTLQADTDILKAKVIKAEQARFAAVSLDDRLGQWSHQCTLLEDLTRQDLAKRERICSTLQLLLSQYLVAPQPQQQATPETQGGPQIFGPAAQNIPNLQPTFGMPVRGAFPSHSRPTEPAGTPGNNGFRPAQQPPHTTTSAPSQPPPNTSWSYLPPPVQAQAIPKADPSQVPATDLAAAIAARQQAEAALDMATRTANDQSNKRTLETTALKSFHEQHKQTFAHEMAAIRLQHEQALIAKEQALEHQRTHWMTELKNTVCEFRQEEAAQKHHMETSYQQASAECNLRARAQTLHEEAAQMEFFEARYEVRCHQLRGEYEEAQQSTPPPVEVRSTPIDGQTTQGDNTQLYTAAGEPILPSAESGEAAPPVQTPVDPSENMETYPLSQEMPQTPGTHATVLQQTNGSLSAKRNHPSTPDPSPKKEGGTARKRGKGSTGKRVKEVEPPNPSHPPTPHNLTAAQLASAPPAQQANLVRNHLFAIIRASYPEDQAVPISDYIMETFSLNTIRDCFDDEYLLISKLGKAIHALNAREKELQSQQSLLGAAVIDVDAQPPHPGPDLSEPHPSGDATSSTAGGSTEQQTVLGTS